jgi:hypothetical protein
MVQAFRVGHKFTNKNKKRSLERKQRQAEKLYLAGKGKRKKKKPKKKAIVKAYPAYPCSAKQIKLGELLG